MNQFNADPEKKPKNKQKKKTESKKAQGPLSDLSESIESDDQ
jgi:hypothetical protein